MSHEYSPAWEAFYNGYKEILIAREKKIMELITEILKKDKEEMKK